MIQVAHLRVEWLKCCDCHSRRLWKIGIKLSHHAALVLQSRVHYLAGGGVQHRQRLLASVQITSYNSHLGLLRSEICRVNTAQSTRAVARPASLRHQSGADRVCRPFRWFLAVRTRNQRMDLRVASGIAVSRRDCGKPAQLPRTQQVATQTNQQRRIYRLYITRLDNEIVYSIVL